MSLVLLGPLQSYPVPDYGLYQATLFGNPGDDRTLRSRATLRHTAAVSDSLQ